MAITSRGNGSSTLNPNAPLFIPLAYQQVEDFSPEWWKLVQSSPWFRDYWLRERYEMFDEAECFADLFPETLEDPDEEDEFCELEEALLHCSAAEGLPVYFGADELPPDFEAEDSQFIKEMTREFEQHEAVENVKETALLKPVNNGKPCKSKYEVKYCEKPPQIVNVKCSPRRIQQPK